MCLGSLNVWQRRVVEPATLTGGDVVLCQQLVVTGHIILLDVFKQRLVYKRFDTGSKAPHVRGAQGRGEHAATEHCRARFRVSCLVVNCGEQQALAIHWPEISL